MKLEYVGPKAVISHKGVSFKDGKEDKFVYIQACMEVFNSINHSYEKNFIYNYNISNEKLDSSNILNEILQLKSNLKEVCEKELLEKENSYKEYIQSIDSHKELNEEELKVYKNNLKLMQPYILQRVTNKVVYTHLVEIIADKIIENKLHEIITPFNERYWHILQTIQGELSNHNNRSIDSSLETIEKDGLFIKLHINTGY